MVAVLPQKFGNASLLVAARFSISDLDFKPGDEKNQGNVVISKWDVGFLWDSHVPLRARGSNKVGYCSKNC